MQTVYIELYIMNSSSALASSLDLDYSVSRLSQAKRKAIPPTVESNRQSKPQAEPRLPRVEWSLSRPFVRNATAACKCKDIGRQWAARLLACRDRNRKSNLVGFNCQPKQNNGIDTIYNAADSAWASYIALDWHLQSTYK